MKKILQARFETLKNDFLQTFGDTKENESFLSVLENQKIELEKIKNEEHREILSKAIVFVSENKFLSEFEFSSLLTQIFVLERILAVRSLSKKRTLTEIEQKQFDTQLYERLNTTISYFRTLKAIGIKNVNRKSLGWGAGKLTQGTFKQESFDLVLHYASFIKKISWLKSLAEKIGHHSQLGKKIQMDAKGIKPAVSYDGIKFDNNLKTILTSELSLNFNPQTKLEFLRRFSDKQLLCYKTTPDKSAADRSDKNKGPVIICLDTSGSMHGVPEALSKAIVLEILKIIAAEKRPLRIISFSSRYEELEIKNTLTPEELSRITEFLSSSFHGGTDIVAAIDRAIQTRKNELKNADILTISDFVASDFPQPFLKRLSEIKRNDCRLFAISIGDRGNSQILKNMDETIIFNKDKF